MIKCIAVLGAGTMGRRIARLFASHGFDTRLFDSNPSVLQCAGEIINQYGDEPDAKRNKIFIAGNLAAAVTEADWIIESVSEELPIKRELYASIIPFFKNDRVVVSSNTSTLPLSILLAGFPFPGRMFITHFFNPADIIPLVEVVKSENTIAELVDEVVGILRSCGKMPVLLHKEIEGFIANRLQAAVLREALYLIDQGVAGAPEIDEVMKQSIGLRWSLNGPFEVADYGGLDIWEKVLQNLMPLLDNSSEVPGIIKEKVLDNDLGVKTGSGFYKYDPLSITKQVVYHERKLLHLLNALHAVKSE